MQNEKNSFLVDNIILFVQNRKHYRNQCMDTTHVVSFQLVSSEYIAKKHGEVKVWGVGP